MLFESSKITMPIGTTEHNFHTCDLQHFKPLALNEHIMSDMVGIVVTLLGERQWEDVHEYLSLSARRGLISP